MPTKAQLEDKIKKLQAAVNKARARAREAEAKYEELYERCQPYIRELGKWRTALEMLEKHSDETGKKLIDMMRGWYTTFVLGPIEEEIPDHPPSGMCVKCPYR